MSRPWLSCTVLLCASHVHLFGIYCVGSVLIFIKSKTFRAWPHSTPILLNCPQLHVLVCFKGSPITLYFFCKIFIKTPNCYKILFAHSNVVVQATIDLSYSPWKASKIGGVYSLLAWINKGVLILILGNFFLDSNSNCNSFFLSFLFYDPFKMLKKLDYIKIRFEMSL
jgi:hypothetical protein